MTTPSTTGTTALARPASPVLRAPQASAIEHARRWWILAVIGTAQLMVILDNSIVNIALPSAQADLGFSVANRQWIVTAYALAFGSLLLLGGRLSDLFGRKVAFMVGLVGFAGASALGGAAVNFGMLVTARAVQGVFGALLAPSALALLTTTFTDGRERGRAFGIFGALAGGGGAIGLLLGGVLTESLSWRWCMYVNLVFAAVAFVGAWLLMSRQPRGRQRARLDVPGVVLVSAALFCVVFGFANAETHSWGSPWAWAFLAGGALLLVGFVVLQTRVRHPLLPLRIVLDRNRGGAYLTILLIGIGMFGIFLFQTFYMQQNLRFTPIVAGVAFLPMVASLMTAATSSTAILLPRVGPKPLVAVGLTMASGGLFWLSFLGVDSSYAGHVLPPLVLTGLGLGLGMAPSINTATRGVRPADAGVASAMVNTMQQVGGSVGTALLASIAGTAAQHYVADHAAGPGTFAAAAVHSYTTAFAWASAIFLAGAVLGGLILRAGPPPAPPAVVTPPVEDPASRRLREQIVPALLLGGLASHIERADGQSPHVVAAAARLYGTGGDDHTRAVAAAQRILRPLAGHLLTRAVDEQEAEGRALPPASR